MNTFAWKFIAIILSIRVVFSPFLTSKWGEYEEKINGARRTAFHLKAQSFSIKCFVATAPRKTVAVISKGNQPLNEMIISALDTFGIAIHCDRIQRQFTYVLFQNET